ncbi:IclR family transcriptional regulator C-terminal domain-containing protein [Mycobacterium sp. 050128]|uniref:IclR family transcriptional regulator n=1 Tax=Mycobacterium sp. 050128 TaxID=3096112 RepID=UPI002ED9BB13
MDASMGPTLIQSLQRGMRFIETIAERGPLTAKSISDSTGIVLPTAYHLLRTLIHEGYLCRSEAGCYALGPQFMSVAQLEGRARDYRLVREAMAQLSGATRSHVLIGRLNHGEVKVWSVIEHPCAPRIECWPGMRLPGHATAIGKSILSRMPDAERDDYFRRNPLNACTSHTVTNLSRLEGGWADGLLSTSEQEFCYGVACAATPMVDVDWLASVGISYAANRSRRARAELDEHLLRAAAVISNLLCHSQVNQQFVA